MTRGSLDNAYAIDLGRILSSIDAREFGPFDDQGLPLVDYDLLFARHRVKVEGLAGVHYTPVTLAFYGLGQCLRITTTSNDGPARQLRRVCDWFVAQQIQTPAGGVWLHRFPMPHLPPLLRQHGGWISAMAQGLAASVLLRGCQRFGDTGYSDAARRGLQVLTVALNDGGVASPLRDNMVFLEEFPTDPPMHVLNGALFALIGLLEYLRVSVDEDLQHTAHLAINGVLELLPEFDSGFASFYDLRRRQIANREYHDLHIQLLRAVGRMTNTLQFEQMSERWQGYLKSTWMRGRWWLAERQWAVRRRLRLGEAR